MKTDETAGFKYWAFISYSSKDRAWGEWLHRAIESFKVPKELIGRATGRGVPVPARTFPIFRDRDELPTDTDLSSAIHRALEASRYLIVICSPHSAQSKWVNKEILEFKRLGRENRVLALIIDGQPNASDGRPGADPARECFPSALRYKIQPDGELSRERTEPIAADARDTGDGRANALLKTMAGVLGVNYDDLKRRDEARRRHQQRVIAGASAAIAIVFAGLAAAAGWQWREAARQREEARRSAALALVAQADVETDHGEPARALALLARAVRSDPSQAAAGTRLHALATRHAWPVLVRRVAIDGVISQPPEGFYWPFSARLEGREFAAWLRPDAGARASGPRRFFVHAEDAESKTLAVWTKGQTAPGEQRRVDGHWVNAEGNVAIIATRPDGGNASSEGVLNYQVWDLQRGLLPITTSFKDANDIVMSDDGASALLLGKSQLGWWDLKTGTLRGRESPREAVCAAFSPTGDAAGLATREGDVWICDAKTGDTLAEFSVRREPTRSSGDDASNWIESLKWSPDGARVLLLQSDRITIHSLLRPFRENPADVILPTTRPSHFAKPSPDGSELLVMSAADTAQIWDPKTGEARSTSLVLDGRIVEAIWPAEGRRIAFLVASNQRPSNYRLEEWDFVSGPAASLSLGRASAVAVPPKGAKVITIEPGERARLWDLRQGQPLGTALQLGKNEQRVIAAAYDSETQKLAVARENTVQLLRWPSGSNTKNTAPAETLALPEGKRVEAMVLAGEELHISAGEQIFSVRQNRTPLLAEAWTPVTAKNEPLRGGPLLSTEAALAQTYRRRLWISRLSDRSSLGTVPAPPADGIQSAVSKAGQVIAIADSLDRIRLYDARDGRVLHDLGAPRRDVARLLFSPEGAVVAAAYRDGWFITWNVQNGARFAAPVQTPALDAASIALSENAEFLVAITRSGDEAQAWRLNPTSTAVDSEAGAQLAADFAEALAGWRVRDNSSFEKLAGTPESSAPLARRASAPGSENSHWSQLVRTFLSFEAPKLPDRLRGSEQRAAVIARLEQWARDGRALPVDVVEWAEKAAARFIRGHAVAFPAARLPTDYSKLEGVLWRHALAYSARQWDFDEPEAAQLRRLAAVMRQAPPEGLDPPRRERWDQVRARVLAADVLQDVLQPRRKATGDLNETRPLIGTASDPQAVYGRMELSVQPGTLVAGRSGLRVEFEHGRHARFDPGYTNKEGLSEIVDRWRVQSDVHVHFAAALLERHWQAHGPGYDSGGPTELDNRAERLAKELKLERPKSGWLLLLIDSPSSEQLEGTTPDLLGSPWNSLPANDAFLLMTQSFGTSILVDLDTRRAVGMRIGFFGEVVRILDDAAP